MFGNYYILISNCYFSKVHVTKYGPKFNLKTSWNMGPIGLASLLEHFIFLKSPNPPQEEVATHKYSHHKISNPPFTNPIYTHDVGTQLCANGYCIIITELNVLTLCMQIDHTITYPITCIYLVYLLNWGKYYSSASTFHFKRLISQKQPNNFFSFFVYIFLGRYQCTVKYGFGWIVLKVIFKGCKVKFGLFLYGGNFSKTVW